MTPSPCLEKVTGFYLSAVISYETINPLVMGRTHFLLDPFPKKNNKLICCGYLFFPIIYADEVQVMNM